MPCWPVICDGCTDVGRPRAAARPPPPGTPPPRPVAPNVAPPARVSRRFRRRAAGAQTGLAASDFAEPGDRRAAGAAPRRWAARCGWRPHCTARRSLTDYPDRPAAGPGQHVVAGRLRQPPGPDRRAAAGAGHRRRHRQRPNRHDPGGARARASGRAPRRRWCPSPATPTCRSPATAATRSTRRSRWAVRRCWRRRSSRPPAFESTTTPRSASAGSPAWSTRVGGVTVCPTAPIDDPLAGINLPAGCQELDGPRRARLRPQPGHPAGRPGSDGRPAGVHVGTAAPGGQPGDLAQPVAVVRGAARGGRRIDRRPRRSRLGPGPAGLGAARARPPN